MHNKQEHDSKIKNFKKNQDNLWNNDKSMAKKQSKLIEKEIKDREKLDLEIAFALSKETAKEESKFNPYGKYADHNETQTSHSEGKEGQNLNEAK